jgi:hypothetical protein
MTTTCSQCGAICDDAARFCAQCGHQIEIAAPKTSQPALPIKTSEQKHIAKTRNFLGIQHPWSAFWALLLAAAMSQYIFIITQKDAQPLKNTDAYGLISAFAFTYLHFKRKNKSAIARYGYSALAAAGFVAYAVVMRVIQMKYGE